jgi:hypothetical protein
VELVGELVTPLSKGSVVLFRHPSSGSHVGRDNHLAFEASEIEGSTVNAINNARMQAHGATARFTVYVCTQGTARAAKEHGALVLVELLPSLTSNPAS